MLASVLVGLAVAFALLPFARDGVRSIIAGTCNSATDPVIPTDDDFAAIILAVVTNTWYSGGAPPADAVDSVARTGRKPVLLSDSSITICPGKRQVIGQVIVSDCPSILDDEMLTWSGADPRISLDMRMQLAQANRAPVAVPALDQWLVRTMSDESIHAAIDNDDRFWSEFYAQFPDTAGFIRVSRPVPFC